MSYLSENKMVPFTTFVYRKVNFHFEHNEVEKMNLFWVNTIIPHNACWIVV